MSRLVAALPAAAYQRLLQCGTSAGWHSALQPLSLLHASSLLQRNVQQCRSALHASGAAFHTRACSTAADAASQTPATRFFISALGARDDATAADLMASLRAALPGRDVQFTGVGGPRMAAAGLKAVISADVAAGMAAAECVEKLPWVKAQKLHEVRCR